MASNKNQSPPVFAEVNVYFRDDTKRVFKQAQYALQGVGQNIILAIQVTQGDQYAHQFPWELVAELETVPAAIHLVGPGAAPIPEAG